ncbi:MAG: hypothetical protein LQ350_000871 [Teloschistes chrysophthalmus]|nr:MAG: hypothetical protein LQ350_000871 [Niorma chrysophthalma]
MDVRSNKRRRVPIEISDEEDNPSSFIESTSEAWDSAKHQRTPGDEGRAHDHVINDLRKDEGFPEHISGQPKTDQHRMAVPLMASPIHLSTVKGLPATHNVDTVSLRDILGDPLIEECWLFNYLIDVDFIMYLSLFGPPKDYILTCLKGPNWMKT